jgi:PPOX class probable FMN-dependent enzyme
MLRVTRQTEESMGDPHAISDLEALRKVIGQPIPGLGLKNQDTISEEARAYIERSPFLVLATSDAEGKLDASPKGDDPGFVLIEDERTLVIPDRPGNKLVYGLQNLLINPRVGVIFMLPGTPETVRVNGIASLTADPELLARLAARGKPAVLAIRVQVEECFHHCAKAFLRSKLWKPETWQERMKISFGKMAAKRVKLGDDVAAKFDAAVEDDYRNNL